MRKLQIRDAEVMKIAIQQEIGRSEESRYDHRCTGCCWWRTAKAATEWRIVWRGRHDCATLGAALRATRLRGLHDGEHTGRPRSLDERSGGSCSAICAATRAVRPFQGLWDGRLLSSTEEALRNRFGVRQCQRLFHQMGFRLRKPGASSPSRPDPGCGGKKNCADWPSR